MSEVISGYSYSEATGNGSSVTFPFSFVGPAPGYINQEDIYVYVRDSDTASATYGDYSLREGPHSFPSLNTITIHGTTVEVPKDGQPNIRIRRIVDKTKPYADANSDDIFRKSVLNNSFLLQLYAQHEALDGFIGGVAIGGFDKNLNMNGHLLYNLARGFDSHHSVNYEQLMELSARIDALEPAGGFAAVMAELAKNTGASKVGTSLGVTVEAYIQSSKTVNPRLPPYNYRDSDPIEARTASLQAAFDAANSLKSSIIIEAYFQVLDILLEGHTEYTIVGGGAIIGHGTKPFVLGIKNCTGLKGGLGITIASATLSHDLGVKVWAEGSGVDADGNTYLKTCSLHHLAFTVVGAVCAWQFGDLAAPDNLMSECVVYGGHTYNVKEVARIIGTQAVIEFAGYQSIVAHSRGGSSTPFTVVGGVLHITGGEVQMPGITDGWMVQLLPIATQDPNFSNKFGSCLIKGAAVECASLWMIAWNPSHVPNVVPGSGLFVMDGCTGFANFSGDNIQTAADFTGIIQITDTCSFHRASAQNPAYYICGAAEGATVKISDLAFDSHFKKGLAKFRPTGQKVLYPDMVIFSATSPTNGAVANGAATDIKMGSIPASGDNVLYYSNYDPATGAFKVPKGGLKGVTITVGLDLLVARPNSSITIVKNGAVGVANFSTPGRWVYQTVELGDLEEDSTIVVRLTNFDGAFNLAQSSDNKLIIRARTE